MEKVKYKLVDAKANGLNLKLIEGDDPITISIQETGLWEPKTTKFIKKTLKPRQVFVDVGASVGYYTTLAAKLVGSNGKVYAFEPLERNWFTLAKNLSQNKLKNVVVFRSVLSNDPALEVSFGGNGVPGQFGINTGKEEAEVELVPNMIFDVRNKAENIIPDMIKIDVEGAQLEVLKGMEKTLDTEKELTIIVEDYSGKAVEWLIERGFKLITTEREAGNFILVKNQKKVKAKEEPITFHLLGTFQTPTNLKEGVGYAFCPKIMNISKALRSQGHKVIFYGAEGSEVECDEFVQVLDKKDLPVEVWHNQYVEDGSHLANVKFNFNCIKEITKRKSKYFHTKDILLVPAGSYQKPVVDAVGFGIVSEVGVGYSGVFTNHKIFESYAWQHFIYGNLKAEVGNFYDMVIPPIFDPEHYTYLEKKEDYFLYLGRITERKGVQIALDTCNAIGAKLKVAGINQGMKIKGKNVEEIGFVGLEKRRELVSKAKAVFVPSTYIEPFGYIIIEAMLSGTPVITTDWGAFTETVQHGKTGFRCRTLAQFVHAAQNIDQIKSKDCRDWGMEFTLEKIAPMYDMYFKQLQNLYGRGWYSLLESNK